MNCGRVFWATLAFSVITLVVRAEIPSAPLLVISLDAFRWDYCNLHPEQTPHLHRLKREGASAHALISGFPSNTFPNHYSIVTGWRPAHHGIINNLMFDPERKEYFRYNVSSIVQQSFWWGGEPIWVTAIKQGQLAACSFWVGSEAEIEGVRPTWWRPYDSKLPFETRLEDVEGWLALPAGKRPNLILFYLEETNSAGHRYGPDAPETVAAIQLLDTRVGRLLDAFAAAHLEPNVVVVSDHGMTAVRRERCVALDDYVDSRIAQIDFTGPAAGIRPLRGNVDELMEKLKNLPGGAKAYRVEDLPERFHLRGNSRIPPIWILPAEGGSVANHIPLNLWLLVTRGEHGFDPELPDMGGILIVHGPAFVKDGRTIDSAENVNLYNLFCAVLGLKAAPNDGDERLVRELLIGSSH